MRRVGMIRRIPRRSPAAVSPTRQRGKKKSSLARRAKKNPRWRVGLRAEVGHAALADVLLPLLQEGPAHHTGAEVGHVLVLRQAIDRLLDDAVVAAEHRTVTGQQ